RQVGADLPLAGEPARVEDIAALVCRGRALDGGPSGEADDGAALGRPFEVGVDVWASIGRQAVVIDGFAQPSDGEFAGRLVIHIELEAGARAEPRGGAFETVAIEAQIIDTPAGPPLGAGRDGLPE